MSTESASSWCLGLLRRLGNGINWKSQVFTQMRNWTKVNNMTGVGNALKRHYQVCHC